MISIFQDQTEKLARLMSEIMCGSFAASPPSAEILFVLFKCIITSIVLKSIIFSIPLNIFPTFLYNFYYDLCFVYMYLIPPIACALFSLWTYVMLRPFEEQTAVLERYPPDDIVNIVPRMYRDVNLEEIQQAYDDASNGSSYDSDYISDTESMTTFGFDESDFEDESEHWFGELFDTESDDSDSQSQHSDSDSSSSLSLPSLHRRYVDDTDDESTVPGLRDNISFPSDCQLNTPDITCLDLANCILTDCHSNVEPSQPPKYDGIGLDANNPRFCGLVVDGCISVSEMFDAILDLGIDEREIDPSMCDSALSLSDFAEPEAWLEDQSGEVGAAIKESFKHFRALHPEMASSFSHIETVMILILTLANVKNLAGATGAVLLYVKTLSPKINENGIVISLIESILEMPMTEQSSDADEAELPDWIAGLKSGKANWNLLRNNPLFGKVSQVCSLLVALGLCSSAAIDFSLGGFKLFSGAVAPKHATALDLFDALADTFVYFIEGGWKCFATGSIAPLLLGDDEISLLIEKITKCENYARLYKNGNLGDENGCMFDENKLETLFTETIAKCNDLLRTTESSTLKKVLLDKRSRLQTCHSDFAETRLKGGLRLQPYCVGFHGRSCKGKSYLAAITMAVILRVNNFAYGDKNMTTLNANDQFWSTFRSDTSGVFLDDMGNENPDYCKVNPTRILLDLVNNVRIYANKAEIESKGRVSVEPRVVIVTKNVKDGNARIYSCEPVAITRRENLIITVECRPEVMDNGKLDARLARQIPKVNGMDDLWLLTLETSYGVNFDGAEHDQIAYAVCMHPETKKPMKDVTLAEALDWMIGDSESWFIEQRKLVERSTEVTSHLEWCEGCNRPGALCKCKFHETIEDDESVMTEWTHPDNNVLEEQSGVLESLMMTVLSSFYHKWYSWALSFFPYILRDIDKLSAKECFAFLSSVEESYWFTWTNYIPEHWMDTGFMKKLILRHTSWKDWFEESWTILFNYFMGFLLLYWLGVFPTISFINLSWCFATIWTVDIAQKAAQSNTSYPGMLWDCSVGASLWALTICLGFCSPAYCTILFTFASIVAVKTMLKRCEEKLLERVSRERESLPWLFTTYREKYIEGLTTLFFAAGAVYCVVKLYKTYNAKMIEAQSELDPVSDDEIDLVDAKATLMKRVAKQFNWDGFSPEEEFDCHTSCCTTSQEQMFNLVSANTCHIVGEYVDDDGKDQNVVNQAFFPCSNVALVPYHMLKKHPRIMCKFVRSTQDVVGANFKQMLDVDHSVRIEGTDMSLIYVDRGGSWKDLTSYFPNTSPKQFRGIFVHKNPSGNVYQCNTELSGGSITTESMTYPGYTYKLQCDTKKGMCMSPIIGVGKKRIIAGFHLAGYSGTPTGAAGSITYGQIEKALAELSKNPSVLISTSATERPDKVYDEQYLISESLHPKSPLNYIENPQLKFSGSVAGRSTFRSQTHKTIISDTVEEVTGQRCEWNSPPVREANPWYETLKHLANPTFGVPAALLNRAVIDYKDQLISMIDRLPSIKASIKKLTNVQTVSGIDGKRFIDAIKWNTAINYMVPGKKEKIRIDLPKEEYPDFECPRDLPEWVWAQTAILEVKYLKGECSYEIFKACLKDEPTHESKTKVRVFEACPLALALLLRKYFLPLARVLSLFPLQSECAVGINPHGPEWDEMRTHIIQFGIDRILAGDYSKYDLRMPPQLTLAAFKLLILLARYTGNYSDDDLKIMTGLATDVCYPKVAYNGDLIELAGSNPSGHSLTVYINSMVNSILFRCGFFDIYPDYDGDKKFSDVVALVTYGDDAKSSVHPAFSKFNHISYATFLSKFGIVFTMPDKTSTPTEYMHDDDADFLKCKNVWNEEAQLYMAALDEMSIFKSLHFVGASKNDDREQAASNINGAIREWFSHGREVYEFRRSQMREVAGKCDLIGWCDQLDVTYDQAMYRWVQTYYPET